MAQPKKGAVFWDPKIRFRKRAKTQTFAPSPPIKAAGLDTGKAFSSGASAEKSTAGKCMWQLKPVRGKGLPLGPVHV